MDSTQQNTNLGRKLNRYRKCLQVGHGKDGHDCDALDPAFCLPFGRPLAPAGRPGLGVTSLSVTLDADSET